MKTQSQHSPNESGQIIVLLAVVMVILLGFAGLAIDGGNVFTQRRRAQNVADNAALAYALKINQGGTSSSQVSANGNTAATAILNANGYVDGVNTVQITITRAPTGYTNNDVRVVLTTTVSTAFIHLVYNGPVAFTVSAIAHGKSSTAPMSGFAIVGLSNCVSTNNGTNVGVTGGGNSGGVNVHNGSIYVNSPESSSWPPCAIQPPNNGIGITVDSGFNITSVGAYNYQSDIAAGKINAGGSGTITTGYNGGTPIGDPLSDLPEPTCNDSNGAKVLGKKVNGVFQPGSYGGVGEVAMDWGVYAPGIYCITGGINPSGNGQIIGTGVLFYLQSGGITLSGTSGMTISAPTTSNCLGTFGDTNASCTYVGMSIYMARDNTSTIDVRGNGGDAIVGTIYALNGTLQARGGGSSPYETSIIGQVIASRVLGNGNGTLDITYNDPKVYHPPASIQLIK